MFGLNQDECCNGETCAMPVADGLSTRRDDGPPAIASTVRDQTDDAPGS